jgi:hypothetical protein
LKRAFARRSLDERTRVRADPLLAISRPRYLDHALAEDKAACALVSHGKTAKHTDARLQPAKSSKTQKNMHACRDPGERSHTCKDHVPPLVPPLTAVSSSPASAASGLTLQRTQKSRNRAPYHIAILFNGFRVWVSTSSRTIPHRHTVQWI